MHERSLVKSLLRQVETLLRQHDGQRVREVKVTVGDFAGVEPALLESAFAQESLAGPARGARLVIRRTSLEGECRDCSQTFFIRNYLFRCPQCRGENLHITGGEELLLESVTVETDR
jgi:hydrogenase nickel incorporation protein HypA/HybF